MSSPTKKALNGYFMPYQLDWLNDTSKIKISEKSRRIGMTYVQAYEDVQDCVNKIVPAVWFSSADESAAKEYIDYCKKWAKVFNVVAEEFNDVIIDEEKDITALVLKFKNGTKIHALSSNPTGFRSKGGKVVLDEFAFHKDQAALWKAARPCITWGFPLRILSTHNGQNCQYFKFVEKVKKGKLNWSLHTTTIYDAVEQGLADKITGKKLTAKERQEWIEKEREDCADDTTWHQEYCCVPIDEAGSFLTYDLISTCKADNVLKPLTETTGDLYVGMDIARKKHLSVITVLEKLGDVKYMRQKIELVKMKFSDQETILYQILEHKNCRRACIDSTGLGMQLAEDAQEKFGKFKVEGITFTSAMKEELAYQTYTAIEDRQVRYPDEAPLTEDFHSLKKIVSKSGNIRFDVEASETDGHADRFWSFSLANHAATTQTGSTVVASAGKRHTKKLLQGY